MDKVEPDVLRAIVEGTAQATGEEFFHALVGNLSLATGVANAFIAEFAESKSRVRTWRSGRTVNSPRTGNGTWRARPARTSFRDGCAIIRPASGNGSPKNRAWKAISAFP